VKIQAGDTANEAEDGMDPVVGAGGLGFTGDQGSEKGTAGRPGKATAPGLRKEAAMYMHERLMKARQGELLYAAARKRQAGEDLV
jgi:hypothetical protein